MLGVAGLVLPILQGLPLLLVGLVILSREYGWARHLLERVRARFSRLTNTLCPSTRWKEKTMSDVNDSMQDQERSDPKFFYFVLLFIAVLIAGGIAIAFTF